MKKILVVDDDPDIVDLIKIRLEANDFNVITASNGVEAFAICQGCLPDLIVLDVCMPNMDGYQFIREIKWKEDLKEVPILILSARAHTKELFEEEGFSQFLPKPFDGDELLRQVNNCFRIEKELAGGQLN